LSLAAALQRGANHPLARAVLERAAALEMPAASDLRTLPGRGIVGTIEGKALALGNDRLMSEMGVDTTPLKHEADRIRNDGRSVSYLGEIHGTEGQALAVLGFGDEKKPGIERASIRKAGCPQPDADRFRAADRLGATSARRGAGGIVAR
jgi:Cu+-exporting ATPase